MLEMSKNNSNNKKNREKSNINTSLKTEDVVLQASAILGCSQGRLARLLSLDPHTFSNNKKKPIHDVSNHTKNRLFLFSKVIREFRLYNFKPETVVKIISAMVLELPDGSNESVLSAIYKNKNTDYILNIAKLAVDEVNENPGEEFQELIEFAGA